jgi:N-methylhydantoinase B/oxoprolinase/acetone carboxylase alpha subunit
MENTTDERFVKIRKDLICLILDTVDVPKLNTISLQLGVMKEMIKNQIELNKDE